MLKMIGLVPAASEVILRPPEAVFGDACLSGMAGHAMYGMASCFGHTGVTCDAENYRPGPVSLQGHFEAARGRFLRLKALF